MTDTLPGLDLPIAPRSLGDILRRLEARATEPAPPPAPAPALPLPDALAARIARMVTAG